MDKERYSKFEKLIEAFDEGCSLTIEYDSLLHDYNGVMLFQAESQVIHIIGDREGITAAEIAHILKKTPSACSQLIRRLRGKGWVDQRRNKENNREYNLYLTEEGTEIYKKHDAFEKACYLRTFHGLDGFSMRDLDTYIAIQEQLNRTFMLDVKESREA